MKHNVIRYGMIVLLIGLVALAAGRANAQTQYDNGLVFLGVSFGMTPGLTARVSMAHLGDGSVRTISASIQVLDEEGNVIAQSDEIRVEPGKIRFRDFPREMLPAGEYTGRIQVRPRILVKTGAVDDTRPPLALTVELIETSTGRTVSFLAFDAGFVGGVRVGT